MNAFFKLAAPAALAIFVTGCGTNPAPIPVPTAMSAPQDQIVPPSAAPTVAEAPAPATPARTTFRGRRVSPGTVARPSTAQSEQTTAGPTAVGRMPAPAQPVGTGGS